MSSATPCTHMHHSAVHSMHLAARVLKTSSMCRAASRILSQLTVLLHAYETGTLRVRLCWRHLEQLQGVQTSTAAALTALSGLVYKTVSGVHLK